MSVLRSSSYVGWSAPRPLRAGLVRCTMQRLSQSENREDWENN
jgi:hypothetical protein